MSAAIEHMRERLDADDVDGFLAAYDQYLLTAALEPAATELTQVVLPSTLRRGFRTSTLKAETIVKLWQFVRDGRLLLVENDLRTSINQRIDGALGRLALAAADLPAQPLPMFIDKVGSPRDRVRLRPEPPRSQAFPPMKRISIASTFSIRTWSASDAFDFRRNLCASGQEREFLRAIRQYFPSMFSYPNIPLRSFIDLKELGTSVPESVRKFAWHSQVDILLCTHDEDPVAGFELDSLHHDTKAAAGRDELKNKLFQLAGLPLVRIRPSDPRTVRAEDFYDLLTAERALDMIRPARLRPRRNHDGLAPAGAATFRRS